MCLDGISPRTLDHEVILSDSLKLGEKFFVLSLESEKPFPEATPGQFVMLRAAQGLDPLLGRPFAICGQERNRIEVVAAVSGRGTRIMAGLPAGVRLSLRGPLGNGFPVFPGLRIHCLAGGMGIAPFLLPCTAREEFEVHLGVPGQEWKPLVDWASRKIPGLHVYSEDGSLGTRGTPLLSLGKMDPLCEAVWACGPTGMLKAISEECGERNIRSWVSLEKRMACGMGGCHGCVIQTRNGPRKTCSEGPVFEGKEVIWNAS
jgi:dihydroorotate dehydrogenase electron transfer subunit